MLRLRGDYLAIVTLGFGEIIRIFMNNLNAPVNITNGPQGINMIKPIEVAGFSLGKPVELFGTTYNSVYIYYYLFLLLAVLTVIICHRLQHSRIGRAWVALREDDVAANAMGLNIRNIKLLAFCHGRHLWRRGRRPVRQLPGLCLARILWPDGIHHGAGHGGAGRHGQYLRRDSGRRAVDRHPELLRDIIGPLQMKAFGRMIVDPENARMLMFGLALIVVMLVRPEGLWPSKRRKAEFHDALDDGIPAADSQAADGLKG